MKNAMPLKAALALTTGLIGMMISPPSLAQQVSNTPAVDEPQAAVDAPQADEPDEASTQDIVVTGTLLRGVAPVGTNVVSVGAPQIRATGAVSTIDVLSRIPQISNSFNRVPSSSTGDSGTTIYKPNIRNLAASGANTTLVLVDGHRIVGAGVLSSVPDPDVVPPSIIERVEIVPDGGSSIYGSDAVGGVINFITRKSFDGFQVSGRYGFADKYNQFDVSATVGKAWDGGSLFASYVYNEQDALFGRDRDYVRSIVPSTSCTPGTVVVGSTTYALPGRVAGTSNTCDTTDNLSIVPSQRRHSAFVGFNQDLSEAVSIDIRGFYTHRETNYYADQLRTSASITAANPNFVPVTAGNTSQTVNFGYGPVAGASARTLTTLDEWGVTPQMTFKLGSGWQLRALANYGRSYTESHQPQLNAVAQAVALAGTTASTALNPYNIAASPAGALSSILNYEGYGQGKQDLLNGRLILDGALFRLPGGDVRVAVGTEVTHEEFSRINASHVPGVFDPVNTPIGRHNRDLKSAFGEVAIPIFGEANGFTGMQSLTLSASGRYDDYSDFGHTFNPKFGATWKPVRDLSIRGNYGTSFNAPSLPDKVPATQLQNLGFSPFIRPGEAVSPGGLPTVIRPTILIAGVDPNLRPQTAKTWSVGADFKPSFIPGLTLSGTYYNIRLKDQITIAFSTNTAVLFSAPFGRFLTFNPTQAQLQGLATTGPIIGAASVAALYANPVLAPYLLYDARVQNLGKVDQNGIDFNASYVANTGFGSLNAGVAGSYILKRDVTSVAGQAPLDDLAANTSRLNLSTSLGATVGGFNASATLYHTSGYKVLNVVDQTRVKSFDVVDLFFAYDVGGAGVLKDLSLTLNLNNVFDRDPPFLNSGSGFTNGSTLGRLVQFGIRKKF